MCKELRIDWKEHKDGGHFVMFSQFLNSLKEFAFSNMREIKYDLQTELTKEERRLIMLSFRLLMKYLEVELEFFFRELEGSCIYVRKVKNDWEEKINE